MNDRHLIELIDVSKDYAGDVALEHVTLYVKTSDVMGAQCLISDRNDVLFASDGAFSIHLDAMHGVTYFAKLS